MKRIARFGLSAFAAAFLLLSVLPGAGILFAPKEEAAGNEHLTELPSVRDEDGVWNMEYLSQLSDYLADHVAFRHELITLHSRLCGALFSSLPNEDVLLGADGWLYYTQTLSDYQGVDLMTPRACYGAARSLALIAEFCQGQGVDFLFTIAPNKNSLYPDAMPARYHPAEEDGNARRIAGWLEEMEVPYLDLFELFRSQDQVLYFRTDSHWNNLGAALAGDALCAALGRPQAPFFGLDHEMQPTHRGDLYEMAYPAGALLEEDAVFERGFAFTYPRGIRSAEDITIRTENPAQTGSLLMFRDSFGNALHPFMAERFGAACFSRAMPYNLTYLEREQADTLVIEIVERNLSWLAQRPAVMPAPLRALGGEWPPAPSASVSAQAAESGDLEGYVEISGSIVCGAMDVDSPVYLRTGDGLVYEAFPAGTGDGPFTLYIPAQGASGPLEVGILAGGELCSCPLELAWE